MTIGSNFVGKGIEDIVERWEKRKKFINIKKPESIKFCNKSMEGCNLLDQLLSYYRVFIRSRKWTLRVIYHVFDVACANSWLEYRKNNVNTPPKELMDLLEFKSHIGESLISPSSVPDRVKKIQLQTSNKYANKG